MISKSYQPISSRTKSQCLLALALGLAALSAQAVTVNTSKKLLNAITNAQPGETIVVQSGTYNFSDPITIPKAKSNITIVGEDYLNCEAPKRDGACETQCVASSAKPKIRKQGFIVAGSNITLKGLDISYRDGVGEPGIKVTGKNNSAQENGVRHHI
jgi:hypothetical protein